MFVLPWVQWQRWYACIHGSDSSFFFSIHTRHHHRHLAAVYQLTRNYNHDAQIGVYWSGIWLYRKNRFCTVSDADKDPALRSPISQYVKNL